MRGTEPRIERVACFTVLLLIAQVSTANALCLYNGELYAKTTLEQEFRDSTLVVKGRVLTNHEVRPPDTDGEIGVLNQVRIDQVFKGMPQPTLPYYSRRDSGGYYLNAGQDYLLFLDPISSTDWAKDASGAMVVNYNCGQSRPWAEVPDADKKRLAGLSQKVR